MTLHIKNEKKKKKKKKTETCKLTWKYVKNVMKLVRLQKYLPAKIVMEIVKKLKILLVKLHNDYI